MRILEHGHDEAGRRVRTRRERIGLVTRGTLEDVPAVVLAAAAGCRLEVDFLDGALADVGDVQIAVGAVEREAPWIAQSLGPDQAETIAALRMRGVGGRG